VGLQLEVAARQVPAPVQPERMSWPALAALLSLVTAGAGVVSTSRTLVSRRPLRLRNGSGEAAPSASA
jgi:hypothetical protein